MEARDLRLGNLIYLMNRRGVVHLPDTIPFRVLELREINCSVLHHEINPAQVSDGSYSIATYSDLEGIPLTEEWLKRFSFYQLPHFTVTNSWCLDIGRNKTLLIGSVGTPNLMVILQETDEEKTEVIEQVVIHNWDYDGEMFVHQLQNLVYSLSKTELTLT